MQGTINGFGERCGNANLVSIIPNLQLKLGYQCLPKLQLAQLKSTSRLMFELLNQPPNKRQAYVGDSAFAHKGGVHVSAVVKNARTYEHVEPSLVGNRRRVLVSDLSGRSNVLYKAKEWGVDLDSKDPETKEILDRLKELESQGFEFEGAEASFELLMQDAAEKQQHEGFRLIGFRVISEKRSDDQPAASPKPPFRSKSTGTSSTPRRSAMVRSTRSTWRFARLSRSFIPSSKNSSSSTTKCACSVASRAPRPKCGCSSKTPTRPAVGARWASPTTSSTLRTRRLVDAIRYKLFKDKKAARKRKSATEGAPPKLKKLASAR